jgi:hypothetical protein
MGLAGHQLRLSLGSLKYIMHINLKARLGKCLHWLKTLKIKKNRINPTSFCIIIDKQCNLRQLPVLKSGRNIQLHYAY